MKKILLCGNGLNINFDEKFKLSEFIDLLLSENRLRNFAMQLPEFRINSFGSDTKDELSQFIFIINKYKDDIEKAKEQLINNGVELVFLEIFSFIEEYMDWEPNQQTYQTFEKIFKKLFFSYILKLQDNQLYQFNYLHNRLKNVLNNYYKIVTLNYDTILEDRIEIDSRNIIHWHGAIKVNYDKTVDGSNCLLDTIRNPKSLQSFPQLGLFKNSEKYKNNFELDIVGLNPLNDDNVFALFFNSQICKRVNFYYHTKNDVLNLKKILRKIQCIKIYVNATGKISLIKEKNNQFLLDEEDEKKYLLLFNNGNQHNVVEINLYHSSVFWKNCQKKYSNGFYWDSLNY